MKLANSLAVDSAKCVLPPDLQLQTLQYQSVEKTWHGGWHWNAGRKTLLWGDMRVRIVDRQGALMANHNKSRKRLNELVILARLLQRG